LRAKNAFVAAACAAASMVIQPPDTVGGAALVAGVAGLPGADGVADVPGALGVAEGSPGAVAVGASGPDEPMPESLDGPDAPGVPGASLHPPASATLTSNRAVTARRCRGVDRRSINGGAPFFRARRIRVGPLLVSH
jgi:hypothetical protein